MATLQEIRAKLKEQETRASGNGAPMDNGIYPFWNMEEGDSAVFRFLPDGDENNPYFWKERLMIKLPFAGIKGESESKSVQVQVPCMEMYSGGSCPILSEVRAWFKDPNLEEMGRKYWKKRSYLFQGFVVSGSLKEESVPENPIRRFIIGPQIFQIIKASLLDPDMEEIPTDYTNGIDFRLNKSSKGGFADYSTSNWSRRSRPLDDAEMEAINNYGLFNLDSFIPKQPGDVELKVIQEMFEASVDEQPYDPDRWSQYYRPAGMAARTGDPTAQASTSNGSSHSSNTAEDDDIPFKSTKQAAQEESTSSRNTAEKTETSSTGSAQDILAMIRARQNQ